MTFQAHQSEELDPEHVHPEPHPTPRCVTMGAREGEVGEGEREKAVACGYMDKHTAVLPQNSSSAFNHP